MDHQPRRRKPVAAETLNVYTGSGVDDFCFVLILLFFPSSTPPPHTPLAAPR